MLRCNLQACIKITLLSIVVVACNTIKKSTINHRIEKKSLEYDLITEDGAWCWFSDPRALYYKGNLEKIYWGYINSQGDVMVSSRNQKNQKIENFILHDTLEIDDHNVPSLLMLPSGHLLAFYNEHNGNVYMRKSINPEDITRWQPEQIIAKKERDFNYTYTNPVRLESENGRIYIFGRKVGPTRSFDNWKQYYKFSDDNGETWSDEKIIFDNEGRINPPYMKVFSKGKSRIDFLFTDGHPKIGDDVSVYHMYYENGKFYQTNGSVLSNSIQLPIPMSRVNKVYDARKSKIRGWIWDIGLNNQNHPVITYARFPRETDHRYHYAYWDGREWIDQEIARAGGFMTALNQGDEVREGHYSGGIVLNTQNTNQVILSRQINGHFELEEKLHMQYGNWKTTTLTSNSEKDNTRPYIIPGLSNYPIILWMSGYYNHYTKYNTGIRLFEYKK
ncbi:BNR-4 repeat-containing protein [Membranihabitans maritimus]|uniref:BNR-4 repeat-containing protein n=1 Tax=Membranihabitans maritimus TaxID=2904244 RepID=UPI001F440F5A|nr:BNR-4 repeat-containing protein [Membranihabitans maritimus]